MPNRILKETICTSGNLNNLSPEEEVFFYRLIVNCDDYGRLDARPQILRARCFPLRIDKVKDEAIERWLSALIKSRLARTYEVNGTRYLQLETWERHQQIRAKRSKYPDPVCNGNQTQVNVCNGNQTQVNVPVIQSNPIQSKSNTNMHLQADAINLPKPYGEFQNVILTEKEYQKLIAKFGEVSAGQWIETFSTGIASKGYKYKSHYAAILGWVRREQKGGKNAEHKGNPIKLVDRDKYTRPEDA